MMPLAIRLAAVAMATTTVLAGCAGSPERPGPGPGVAAEMAGAPCGLYFTWDEASKTTDMAGAVPVKKKTEAEGFSAIEIPATEALLIEFYGDYHNIGAAHTAMEQYIAATGAKTTPPAIEEYVTDPGTEKDASKWLTKVYYPLEQ